MQVSIIIPARNAAGTLGACLDACLAQTHPDCEVLVVDDGSTDDTAGIAADRGVRCVPQQPRGPAAARNHGAAATGGPVLAFTDADCIPRPDWVAQLLAALDEDGAGAAGGTYAIANPASLLARMIQEEVALRHNRYDRHVDFLGSFNLAVRRAAFEQVGGFDEDFTAASAEDNDLAYRLTAAGWKLVYEPQAVVAHYHPERLGRYLRAQARHGFWRVKLYAKHPGRASGDRYAGLADLLAPGIALAFAALVAGLPALWLLSPRGRLAYASALFIVFFVYAAIRVPRAVRMALRTRSPRFFEFGDVAALRDLARGLGMLRGVWRFLVMRRRTA